MGLSQHLPKERWRRLGMFNVSMIVSCGLILTISLLSVTLSRPGSTITEAKIIFDGKCSTSNRLDLFLQFVINIFSTCVLASSNFFMQIVSSPTRKELDHAHRSLHSLEIGVSSFKNLGALSWFKILAWAGLFLTSVPIHLLFNSAIYPIDYQGSDWHLTIATPGFVDQTVDYFVPGASLATFASGCPTSPNGTNLTCSYSDITINIGGGYESLLTTAGHWGFGQNDSLARTNITWAAQHSSSWDLLTPSACFDEYRFCKPRQKYRNLVVVVDEVPGWTRSEVYNFSGNAASNLSQFWDPQIPPDSLNSLWYSAPCRLYRYGGAWDSMETKICASSRPERGFRDLPTGCSGALGEPSGVDWLGTTELQGSWRIPFRPANMTIPSSFGYDTKFSELPVKHCMAEPNPDYTCKLGLAPPLLLIVIGCVFLKGVICSGILFRLTDDSLVTPGDAISSFISQPDPSTSGLATMGFADADRLEYDSIEKIPVSGLLKGPMARRWKHSPHRFRSVLSRAVWVRTYSILIAGMALIATGLGLNVTGNGAATLIGTFGKAATTNIAIQFTYLGALLMANTPQLILSFCYFALNSFLTRIQVEEEWNSYSRSYKPLRVSSPKGAQISHYRLQLPYKYSIPLIGMSILLHWVLSNAIFVIIIEGGFWASYNQEKSLATSFGASEDSYVAVGVSGSAILIMFVISGVLCISLALFSLRKVSGDMVSGGTNSLVMSAACHVPAVATQSKSLSGRRGLASSRSNVTVRSASPGASPVSSYQQAPSIEGVDIVPDGSLSPYHFPAKTDPPGRGTFGQQQEVEEDEEQLLSDAAAGDEETTLLEEVAMSKIRWGAIAANPGILGGLETDEVVLHLGFGTEDHNVEPPREGRLYI